MNCILSAQGVIKIRPCGVAYWLITLSQLPAAVAFTGYIIYAKRKKHVVHSQDQEDGKVASWQFYLYYTVVVAKLKAIWNDDDDMVVQADLVDTGVETLSSLTLPLAAFVTGALSGLFGIGGGLLLNPVLLQIGIPPQVHNAHGIRILNLAAPYSLVPGTSESQHFYSIYLQTAAATSSFMVLFCASMSMVQFILLGVEGIGQASIYAGICFVASVIGVAVIERAIRKSGRVSLIVFLVTAIMALSTVIVTCFGALDVWMQYTSGEYMGFKLPC